MEDASKRIFRAVTWAQNRLRQCESTRRNSMVAQSRDWAYGESVAIKAMLAILNGDWDGEQP